MGNGQNLQLSSFLGYYAMMSGNKRLDRTSQMTQTFISAAVTNVNLVIIKKLLMRSFPSNKPQSNSQQTELWTFQRIQFNGS
jgi:hypothetical protein